MPFEKTFSYKGLQSYNYYLYPPNYSVFFRKIIFFLPNLLLFQKIVVPLPPESETEG